MKTHRNTRWNKTIWQQVGLLDKFSFTSPCDHFHLCGCTYIFSEFPIRLYNKLTVRVVWDPVNRGKSLHAIFGRPFGVHRNCWPAMTYWHPGNIVLCIFLLAGYILGGLLTCMNACISASQEYPREWYYYAYLVYHLLWQFSEPRL